MQDSNPYLPPKANVHSEPAQDSTQLASRKRRLAGAMIDGLIVGGANSLYIYFTGQFALLSKGVTLPFAQQALNLLVFAGFFFVINGYLLYKNGQTVGKLILGMKIIRVDGAPTEIMNLAVFRYVPQWLVTLIPVIGGVFSLIDVLFIFRRDNRCVHDLLAGTEVVKLADK
jgi:uncharacterized RDD family membrane protein YckC